MLHVISQVINIYMCKIENLEESYREKANEKERWSIYNYKTIILLYSLQRR